MLGLEHALEPGPPGGIRITLAGDADGRAVSLPDGLLGISAADWLTPGSVPAAPPVWLEPTPDAPRLPVLFGVQPADPRAVQPDDGGATVPGDLLGSAFFLLTRYEEAIPGARDAHGRNRAADAVAGLAGLVGRPLVDEYADVLWAALSACWPRLERRRTSYAVRVSHDVDHPFATLGVPARAVSRQLLGDVARRRDAPLAARRALAAAVRRSGLPSRFDPANNFHRMMDVADARGLRVSFNLLATDARGPYDPPYRLADPGAVLLASTIAARGHDIGYHGSYGSMDDPGMVAAEYAALRRLTDSLGIVQARWGGRQHYLRWNPAVTWRAWDAAGLDFDSSAGFAEEPGFRTGTCREHAVFDVATGTPLRLRERPLMLMLDATLFQYLELTPEAAARRAADVAATVRRHGGTLELLIHNDILAEGWARAWYTDVLDAALA
jgi:hypothetical protein